jgi:hypothetical protein
MIQPRRCAACDAEEPVRGFFKLCARCGKAAYCSKACQKADWRARHKRACAPDAHAGGAGAGAS